MRQLLASTGRNRWVRQGWSAGSFVLFFILLSAGALQSVSLLSVLLWILLTARLVPRIVRLVRRRMAARTERTEEP